MSEVEKVGLAGDWHGNSRWAMSVLHSFNEAGIKTVYQLGDFGFWPGHSGREYLLDVVETCAELGITLWITPGNHEDYTQIVDPETENGEVPDLQVIDEGEGWQVAVLPRGYRWEVAGRTFVSLGGAPSIDFEQRTEGKSWWPEEMIRNSDLERLEPADIMLTHDAPDGGTRAVQDIIETPPSRSMWSVNGLSYAARGRRLMNEAIEIVKPQLFAHGHMHVTDERYDDDSGCLYLSLGPDGTLGNLCILDLKTMTTIWAGSGEGNE